MGNKGNPANRLFKLPSPRSSCALSRIDHSFQTVIPKDIRHEVPGCLQLGLTPPWLQGRAAPDDTSKRIAAGAKTFR